jgi:hypothetical protein
LKRRFSCRFHCIIHDCVDFSFTTVSTPLSKLSVTSKLRLSPIYLCLECSIVTSYFLWNEFSSC